MADHDATGLAELERLLAAGLPIVDVHHDSRLVAPGSLFACLRGSSFDGHDHAAAAVAEGATALLVDHVLDGVGDVAQIVVDDTRVRLGPIAARVHGHPSEKLTTVGITGTNGKTTTAHLLASVLEAAGETTGIVGTLHGPRTTPEAPELQRTLAGFVAEGRTAAVLEVSSHALALHRADGTRFDAVVFTNLGHDHLDLHGSHEAYFRAKASLFRPAFSPVGVLNVDDTHGRLLADSLADDDGFAVVPYSVDDATELEVTADAHRYRWRDTLVEVPLGGRFNVSNSVAAMTTAAALGIDPAVAATGLAAVAPVPGRFEVVRSSRRDLTVVVDYAHTPDGLAEVLDSARRAASGGEVVVTFGCGGDRDRAKRSEMGAVAARLADRVVITSDNPRSEPPGSIIDDILAGITEGRGAEVVVEPDRATAIRAAIAGAAPGAVVVIAGKGHERTQELADTTIDFDDRVVARAALEATS